MHKLSKITVIITLIPIFFGVVNSVTPVISSNQQLNLDGHAWIPITSQENPNARYMHEMVFDPFNNRVILYGGSDRPYPLQHSTETWEFNLDTHQWHNISLSLAPPTSQSTDLFLDRTNQQLLLFPNPEFPVDYNVSSIWIFNLQNDTWFQAITEKGTLRNSQAGCWDLQNNRILFFGGYSDSGHSNDMWGFNLSNNSFSQLDTLNTPSGRYGAQMIYSSKQNRTYLFGGRSTEITNDLFEFNSNNLTWRYIQTENEPPVRYWHSMTYLEDTDEILVFGGRNYAIKNDALNDTWILDLETKNWRKLEFEDNPDGRFCTSLAQDTNTDQILLFGGAMMQSEIEKFNDTWLLTSDDIHSNIETNTFQNSEREVNDSSSFTLFSVLLPMCILALLTGNLKRKTHQ